uniref:Uncharacterized protein n=1 Tax=viral metagenome TaxID=1070528 RepID=A0A6C0DPU7_9ZZZZ
MAKDKKLGKSVKDLLNYIHDNVQYLNGSKIFAGCMIIILNIASRFVNIKLSKSMEAYLKFTFSRQVLVFAIAWMGTRDIYIAFTITIIFTILFSYLLNEDSEYCILHESFKEHHINLLDNEITDEDIKKAKEVLERAEKKKKLEAADSDDEEEEGKDIIQPEVVGISTFSFK